MSVLLARKSIRIQGIILRPLVCTTAVSQHRNAGTYHHALVPKGRGGRSSFSGTVAAVFGATGFVGRYLVSRLGREGSQTILPHRCDVYDLNHLKPTGDLGQVLFREFSLEDGDLIKDIMSHCTVVINLLGANNESRRYPYESIHIDAAGNLARYAKEVGVPRYIHMSALNADIRSPIKYLSTKGAGEQFVREQFPEATILRPAQIYGPEDRYFNHFANQHMFGNVPLFKEAQTIVKRPVYVSDVSQAIMAAMKDDKTVGRTYELMGPKGYLLTDLVEFIYRVSRRPYVKPTVPRPLLRAVARAFEITPFTPWLSREMLDLQHTDEHITPGVPGLEDLGIKPVSMEEAAIRVLRRHRADRYFDLGIDDIEPAPFVK